MSRVRARDLYLYEYHQTRQISVVSGGPTSFAFPGKFSTSCLPALIPSYDDTRRATVHIYNCTHTSSGHVGANLLESPAKRLTRAWAGLSARPL